MRQPVTIIGMGMCVADLTPDQRQRVQTAEVLVGGRRHLAAFADLAAEKIEIGKGLDALAETIGGRAASGARVVVLASGDPLYHGIGHFLVERLGSQNVRIHPNVTAVGAAFARLRRSWHDIPVVSLHGRSGLHPLLAVLAREPVVAVLTDPQHDPSFLAGELGQRGLNDARLWVLERLGQADERVCELTLTEAAGQRFADPNLLVVEQPAIASHGFGLPETVFEHSAGLITKAEVRAVSLARLRIQPWHTVWDLGAGSGSVALEAAALAWRGRVVAVEKDPQRVLAIEANRRRLRRWHVDVVQAQLPEGMAALPDPQRVFVGGGGRDLERILQRAAGRLDPNGAMVVNTVLLESLETARHTLRRLGLVTEVIQVQVSRGLTTAGDQRLAAENPVWIVTGTRETGAVGSV